ncbi:hypothetical protein N1851_002224 [Merluccius polli]|uniref:Uncharacterized protein n=1 Tax=Merluccius polli TaxID=89951 RepID=A0AA47PD81_MERPO|nr:hypothetical protein N1851_002224 [Merluccius polli]
MKRIYESGSQKMKKKDQRQEFIAKLPKLSSFFTGAAVATGPSAEQEPFALTGNGNVNVLPAPVNPSGSGSGSGSASSDVDVNQQTDRDDAQLAVSNSMSPSSSTSDIDYENASETHILVVEDPALWPKLLTDIEGCSIVRMGPVQVKDKDFPQNEKGRRFTKANYYIVMKNAKRLMAQFDPVMREHLRRIQAKEASDTYLSSRIQNEVVSLVAKCTTDAIVDRRLYSLFSSSVHRWTILKDHVKTFTFPDILNALTALEDHAKEKLDAEVASSARRIFKEMQTWPFLVSTIVWYNVLYQISKLSKLLQSPTVSVDTFRRQITAVTGFLQEFREMGFNSVKTDAREIAEEIEVEMTWLEVRKRRAKRQFEYEGGEETQGTAEEIFKREVFLPLVDTALVTVKERFSHMETFFQLYGFLYSKDLMKSTKEAGRLGECCHKLEQATEDVEAQDLRLEVEGAVQSFPTDISTLSEMLNHIYKENIVDLYPNLSIALRFLLTLPVTVASGSALRATGSGATGPGATGPGATGPGATGPGNTGPGNTGPGNTGPGNTGPTSHRTAASSRQLRTA